DLTFVQLPNIKQLGTLKATKSFWPLDNPELTPPTYDFSNTLLCTLGSRQVHQDMVVSGNRVTLDIGMIGYCGVYEMAHEFSAGRFDYIDTVVNYELGSKNLPQSFKGLSGGGLWAFRVSTPDHGKTFRIKDPFLSGVAFYQTERKDNIRKIRHHFVGSIYKEVLASLS
ncbi:MAG: hypothetical protein OEQ53_14365, partial [Saprospiraceae bacterium]|nr:hypothetical protein [Saprospiraceae bacterium]